MESQSIDLTLDAEQIMDDDSSTEKESSSGEESCGDVKREQRAIAKIPAASNTAEKVIRSFRILLPSTEFVVLFEPDI